MNDLAFYLSVASGLVGVIGGPISLYFSYKAAKNSEHAVCGTNELAQRVSSQPLYDTDAAGAITNVKKMSR